MPRPWRLLLRLSFLVAQVDSAAQLATVPSADFALELGFCSSNHDFSWPAVVASARKAFEAGDPLLPLPEGAASRRVNWHLVFAHNVTDEVDVGFTEMLGKRLWSESGQPVHALVGCSVSEASEKASALSSFLHVPMISWVSHAESLSNKFEYPYFLRTCGTTAMWGKSFAALCHSFGWAHVGYLYGATAAGTTAFQAASDCGRVCGIRVDGYDFQEGGDEGNLQSLAAWTDTLRMASSSGLRAFGVAFSTLTAPRFLELAREENMNTRLLIPWELISMWSVLSDDLRLSFNGMLGISEVQMIPPYSDRMAQVWHNMTMDELEPLGVPPRWVQNINETQPDLFQHSPFFMNHAQLVDAITSVLVAFGHVVAEQPEALGDPLVLGAALRAALYKVSFDGVSGHVSYSAIVEGRGGDRESTPCSLYEADAGGLALIGRLHESQVSLDKMPSFPNGLGKAWYYDMPVKCQSDQVRKQKEDGEPFCAPCPVSFGETCVPAPLFAGLLAALLSLIATAAYGWMLHQRLEDKAWLVKGDEVIFRDPPEQLGRGTFGYVVKAEYRGTPVAVKRVIPPALTSRRSRARSTILYGLFDGDEESVERVAGGRVGDEEDPEVGARISDEDNRCPRSSSMSTTSSSSAASISREVDGVDENADIYTSALTWGGKFSRAPSRRGCLQWEDLPCCSAERSKRRLQKVFVREMRTLTKLRHPCIVTVMGAVISPTHEPMLVTEFMDHGSLRDLLRNKTLPLDELATPMLQDVVRGLRYLHACKPTILHCDLKASNVFVDGRFRAKIADFGLSQRHKALSALALAGSAGAPLGRAPELLRGGPDTMESDVYTFGGLLFEVESRGAPGSDESLKELRLAMADSNTEDAIRPHIPATTPMERAVLIRDCWRTRPELRPTIAEIDRRLSAMDPGQAPDPWLLQVSGRTPRQRGGGHPAARCRADTLLFDVFPRHIAESLRDGRKVEPEHRDSVTIFFSDIVGFTNISGTLEPHKVSDMLDRLYSRFDQLSREVRIFKVETIGDAYMAVANLVEEQPDDHAARIALFAARAVRAAQATLIDEADPSRGPVNIRVGFHSGPVVADVVGTRNPRYCLFGNTVLTASRMESHSERNRMHCSAAAAQLLRRQAPEVHLESRGIIDVKDVGEMETYWVGAPSHVEAHLAAALM